MSTNHSGNVVSGVYCLLTLRLWNRRFESPSGPPRAGSGPSEKILSGPPPSKGGPARGKLEDKEAASYARWPLAASAINTTRHYLTHLALSKKINTRSEPRGQGNLYRPPSPTPPPCLAGTDRPIQEALQMSINKNYTH